MSGAGHVFAYGSLVAPTHPRATLRGRRAAWGVAMDNRVALAGYKVYEEPDGTRPPVDVAFLDLVEGDGEVHGTLLAADAVLLAALDRRERQYRRVEVTADVTAAPDGAPVWAYVGRPEARARVDLSRAVVIQRAYRDGVRAALAALGPDALAGHDAATEPPPFPVLDLRRVDLP